jgi:(E)-4-hydroxy-3-methylbut-2-enyl-diphosphate synthase
MCSTDTKDVEATVAQINALTDAGCEIARVAVYDRDAINAYKEIISASRIPVVADIHFDYKLAIASLEAGAPCVRINPGNIGGIEKTLDIVRAAKQYNSAIRVGVNSGSLEKEFLDKYGVCSKSLVESALRYQRYLEDEGFLNFKLSIKASNVPLTVESCTDFAAKSDTPLHIGVTEAGTLQTGTIKSAIGIGVLLFNGIGDTLRVSLTADPVFEVKVAWDILKTTGVRKRGIEVISCPTCARASVDIINIANQVEKATVRIEKELTIAVMGCTVNGPGEAKEADIGVACGKDGGVIFKKGTAIKKVSEKDITTELINIVNLFDG